MRVINNYVITKRSELKRVASKAIQGYYRTGLSIVSKAATIAHQGTLVVFNQFSINLLGMKQATGLYSPSVQYNVIIKPITAIGFVFVWIEFWATAVSVSPPYIVCWAIALLGVYLSECSRSHIWSATRWMVKTPRLKCWPCVACSKELVATTLHLVWLYFRIARVLNSKHIGEIINANTGAHNVHSCSPLDQRPLKPKVKHLVVGFFSISGQTDVDCELTL